MRKQIKEIRKDQIKFFCVFYSVSDRCEMSVSEMHGGCVGDVDN